MPARKLTLQQKQHLRDYKADLVARGLCRQCTAKRGNSPSTTRCKRCYLKARAQNREYTGAKPYSRRARGGRPPLDVKGKRLRPTGQPAEPTTAEFFAQPIDRGE